ncbi:hypothetical protein AD998_20320 [bacterium 336/3]|nr:hypothetical protein AD998_20320 [bacterium 336/3]
MDYKFYTYNFRNTVNEKFIEVPSINIENASEFGYFFLDEISNLYSNLEYINEIVDKIDKVLNGSVDFYEGFGYKVYMIQCDKNIAKVVNLFENEKIEAEIPTIEIYALMKDWRDYLIKFYDK